MRVLGLIPARGGSKGVPRKNIRLLAGKPLLQYTAESAIRAKMLTRVILSTEDIEIANVAKNCGVEVPFMRPLVLATDEAPSIKVVQHALQFLENEGDFYESVCLLQPTSPLRLSEDIDRAIELLECTGADSVISFVEVGEKHPARMKIIDNEGKVVDPAFAEQFEGQRRQELTPLFLREGSIYLTRRDVLIEQSSFKGNDCRALIIPVERACNIDTEFDFFLAEQTIKYLRREHDKNIDQ